MEFFEQAHASKSTESFKKDENIKRQLKQMLFGYKNNDNELIKSSVDIKIDNDDSSSVSGFSDLNLTVSSTSGADDTTRATIGSPDDVDYELDDLNVGVSTKITNLTLDSDDDKQSGSVESNAEVISTTSYDLPIDTDEYSTVESIDVDEDESLLSSVLTSLDTESSQDFDPEGLLASKIHENLQIQKDKKIMKRKLDKVESNTNKVVYHKIKIMNKTTMDPKSLPAQCPSFIEEDLISINTSVNECTAGKSLTKLPDLSPSYIAITAADMEHKKFDDVVGIYKHSIVKNTPYHNNEHIFSENDTSFVSTNVMTYDKQNINEEFTDQLPTTITKDDITQEIPDESTIESSQNITIDESIEKIDDTLIEKIDDTLLVESVEVTKNDLNDSVKVYFKGKFCICVMKHPAKLFVNGKFKVQSLGGMVEVFGYTIGEKPNEIYAPYYNFAQCLSTMEKITTFYGLFTKLTKAGLTVADAEEIVTTLEDYDAVLMLQPLRNEKIKFVEEHFSVANLFSKPYKHIGNCHVKALEKLDCFIHPNQPSKVFKVPISWQEINKYCFNEQSRGIFCGGKGVGKSTCLRYHVNKLLAHGPVLVIDLDMGQSEFTVAGNISACIVNEPLLGPSYTHMKKPKRTLNLGMINPLDNMKRYMNAVVSLIAYCASDEQLKDMRWIVNTMGLCNVVGLHFITTVILHCQPTYLLQIDSKNTKRRFDMFLRPNSVIAHYEEHKYTKLFANTVCPANLNYCFVLSHHTESPIRNNNSPLAPRDERYLNFLAYFSELLTIHKCSKLLAVPPYEVQLQDLCVYMNVKIPEGTVQQVLNGKIVALCQHEPGSVTQKTQVLADAPLLCHGHGLIRGIDFEKGILFLITPLSIEGLQVVNALLYADWVPELRGQEADLPVGTEVPYRMPTMYQQKQLMFTPRRRFNPIQLLKMSKN